MQISQERIEIEKNREDTGVWNRSSIFDEVPNQDAMRAAQKLAGWNAVGREREFFANFRKYFFNRLLIAAWIVGAGKTLGMMAIACAVNHAIRKTHGPKSARIRRILILTKEEALRDQICEALSEQCVSKGLFTRNPKVLKFDKGKISRLGNDDYEVVVACAQILWPGKEGAGVPRSDINGMLAPFDLIFFDEPHFAEDQVDKIAKAAPHALCFGMTGTPIEANGDVLKNFALLSVYDYKTSVEHDGALKFVSNRPEHFDRLVDNIKTVKSAAEYQARSRVYDGVAPDHDKQVSPDVQVVDRVISEIKRLDREVMIYEAMTNVEKLAAVRAFLSPHRDGLDHVQDVVYDPHAMIVVRSKEVAEALTKYGNARLSADKEPFTKRRGYKFVVVHSGQKDSAAPEKLSKIHPWLLAANNDEAPGRIVPDLSARFLVVVSMAREGMDNPACVVVGAARGTESYIEVIQRYVGRPLRAIVWKERLSDGQMVLHAPIPALDSIRIVTHESFKNVDNNSEDFGKSNGNIIKKAFDFVANMDLHFSQIPTIREVIDPDYKPEDGGESKAQRLTERDKLEILGHIGEDDHEDNDPFGPRLNEWLDEQFGHDENRRNEANNFVLDIQEHPEEYRAEYEREEKLTPYHVVTDEEVEFNPTIDDLRSFVRTHGNSVVKNYLPELGDNPNPQVVTFVSELYRLYEDMTPKADFTIDKPLSRLVRGFVLRIQDSLGPRYAPQDPGDAGPIYRAVYRHVHQAFGVPQGEKAEDDSRWGGSRYKGLLLDNTVANKIIRATERALIREGYCPTISDGLDRLDCNSAQAPGNRRSRAPTEPRKNASGRRRRVLEDTSAQMGLF